MRLMTVIAVLALAPVPSQAEQILTAAESIDNTFVTQASGGGTTEVKLGKLAQGNAASEAVKRFGGHMIADHSKAGDELADIAKKLRIELPREPSKEQEATLKQFAALKGKEFDQAYSQHMVEAHEKTIALFEQEAGGGQSDDLKSFAAKTLPTIQEHLKMAKGLPK